MANPHPRAITNWPLDFPDEMAQAFLSMIAGQLDRALSEVFDIRSEFGSVSAAQNTQGLTVTLDLGPTDRPVVQRFISAGGGATVQVQVSRNGTTWRTVESQTSAFSSTTTATLPGIGYRYVRVTSATTGIALEFELTACR